MPQESQNPLEWSERDQATLHVLSDMCVYAANKSKEFCLPPILMVGILETVKNQWLNPDFFDLSNNSDE